MAASPKVISVTGLSSTAGFDTFLPDYNVAPFALGLGVTSSNNTYNVEHTFDNLASPSTLASTSATWFLHSTLAALSSNANGNYAFPVRGIRLNVTAGSSTAITVLTIISAG